MLINFTFDCDSEGVVYVMICKTCRKVYVGSTITSSGQRLNNQKSSATRYSTDQSGTPEEHLYAHSLVRVMNELTL